MFLRPSMKNAQFCNRQGLLLWATLSLLVPLTLPLTRRGSWRILSPLVLILIRPCPWTLEMKVTYLWELGCFFKKKLGLWMTIHLMTWLVDWPRVRPRRRIWTRTLKRIPPQRPGLESTCKLCVFSMILNMVDPNQEVMHLTLRANHCWLLTQKIWTTHVGSRGLPHLFKLRFG